MSKEIQNVKIYACGGAGTSIVRELRNQVDCKEIVNGFSGYQVTYVNTSESDFRDLNLFEKQLKEWGDTAYFYKGIDGSGKNQTRICQRHCVGHRQPREQRSAWYHCGR